MPIQTPIHRTDSCWSSAISILMLSDVSPISTCVHYHIALGQYRILHQFQPPTHHINHTNNILILFPWSDTTGILISAWSQWSDNIDLPEFHRTSVDLWLRHYWPSWYHQCGLLHTFMVVFMFDFVQFCFIFCFMLIYPWEPWLYLYSLPQYIFCIFLWFNKNTFPHSSELRKHRTRLVSFRPLYLDLDLNIFDSVPRLVSYYIIYISVPRTLATHICSESHRLSILTLRLHRDIDLNIDLLYTHLTLILPLLEGLLANSHLLILLLWCLCWFLTI
jgi:hypothetical protein